ncbi:hypothetical protein CHARACLAT_004898 [Characodon lateralis]|uniref:Uncharacterized protein n=1 Tax=Characodon lateralis TaxID=208331 RepID=A0ABU7E737_9TELE|nr:hypothetical protein [Characodon lateralis]
MPRPFIRTSMWAESNSWIFWGVSGFRGREAQSGIFWDFLGAKGFKDFTRPLQNLAGHWRLKQKKRDTSVPSANLLLQEN